MLTAIQFWTPARREELRKWRERPTIGGGWRPANLKRLDAAPWIGRIVTEDPCKGYRHCTAWPADMEVQETCLTSYGMANNPLDHNGWYTDSFQDGCQYAAAVKVRVPRRRAKREGRIDTNGSSHHEMTRVRWVEAIAHTDWGSISIDRCTLHDTLRDAIRAADSVAKRVAESCREEDMKFQAEQKIQEKREEVAKAKSFLRDLIVEIRLIQKFPGGAGLVTFDVLKERVCDELREIREARERIALLEREPWEAVSW